MTSENKRCVVTGLGVICAIGNNVEETWKNALNSVSGIQKTTSVDTTNCYANLAAEVKCDTLDSEVRIQRKRTGLQSSASKPRKKHWQMLVSRILRTIHV